MGHRTFGPSVALFSLLTLGLAGCGGSATATGHNITPTRTVAPKQVVATATPLPPVPTPTAPAVATSTVAPATATETAEPPATATAEIATSTPTAVTSADIAVTTASISPGTVAADGTISLSAQTTGDVRRVQVYLGSGEPNAPAPKTYELGSDGGGSWSGSGQAPGAAGAYHYSLGLFNASGHVIHIDNNGWNITVTGSGNTGSNTGNTGSAGNPGSSGNGASEGNPIIQAQGPQPLPGNMPLAPPFSYGNPVVAIFSAAGQTISGSEVVSSTISSVSATTVADYYSVHLARAGWTITSGASPGPGATSFTISATSGSEVVVISYASGTQHIYYGPVPTG